MPGRIARKLVNLVWYSTALAIVVAALFVTLGRELLPRISLQSDAIARQASTSTGADIHFENLRGQWVRLLPEISASSVAIKKNDLDIRLNQVKMHVDVLACLLERRIVLERLEIHSADILYHMADATNQQPVDIDETSRVIFAILRRNIQIQNVSINIVKGDKKNQFNLKDLRVEQTLMHRKVFLRLLGSDGEEDLFATGTLSGNTLSKSDGHFYLAIGDWPLQEWLPATESTLNPAIQAWRNAPWHFGGKVWIDWSGMDTIRAIADLHLNNPSADNHLPTNLHIVASSVWQPDQQQLLVHSLEATQKDNHEESHEENHENRQTTLLENVQLTHTKEVWHLQSPAFQLEPLKIFGTYLPQGTVQNLLQSLQLSGTLRNLDVLWNNTKPLTERMRLRATADNLASQAWHGVPAFTKVNGYVDSGIGYGFIDLNSQDGFSMHYPDIYHEPLSFDRAAGRVQWNWLPEEKTVLVGSDFASLAAEDGEARGNFWINLPLPGATSQREMYLAIGLRDSQAKYRNKYLPYILPKSLMEWLESSIGNAIIPDAGFIYRGPLSGQDHLSRSIQFYANLNHGDLQFDPRWPRLQNLDGKLLVDDGETIVRTTHGTLYNTRIDDTWVKASTLDGQLVIDINARANGPAEDGIRILRDTTLRDILGNTFDNWRITQGQLVSNLQLSIPLSGEHALATQDVRCQLTDTSFLLDDLRLPVEHVTGNLTYQSSTGLSSPRLDAILFSEPVQLQMSSQKTAETFSVLLTGTGKANTRQLADWSRLTPLLMLSGDMDYNAKLALDLPGGSGTNSTSKNNTSKNKTSKISASNSSTSTAKFGTLTLESNMKNITLPLPEPLSKKPGTTAPLKMTVDLLSNNRQDYQLDFNGQINAALSLRSGNLYGGTIEVADGSIHKPNQANQPTVPAPLQINATLPHAGLEAWSNVIGMYNQLPKPATPSTTPYPAFSLTIDNFTWTDQSFPNASFAVTHVNNGWQAVFTSERAKGSAHFFDALTTGVTPIPDINFDTLKIDSSHNEGASTTGKTLDFSQVPSLFLGIEHFVFNEMDIGQVRMELESQPNALLFKNAFVAGPGYKIKGKKSDETQEVGADLAWRKTPDGIYQSEFHGMLHMQGPQPALTHLGIDPIVQGENIYLNADIAWPGSPLDMTIESLYGQVETHGKKGKYLQAKPTAAMHAINVVDIATWVRRLRLDFSDLSNDGISFDKYKGSLMFNNGTMEFTEPLHVESPSSSIQMAGKALLNSQQLDLKLTATLPVGNNAAWIAGIAGGLPAAAGVYLISKVFSDQLETITSLSYTITGPMSDPDIEFKRIAPPKLATEKPK